VGAEGTWFAGGPGCVEFFGRRRELEKLGRLTRDLSRGWGRTVHLWGSPGVGKTELLRSFTGRLYEEEGAVLPIYYSLPRLSWSLSDFAVDFAAALSRQYLAFTRQPGTPAPGAAEGEALLKDLMMDSTGAGQFLAERYRSFGKADSHRPPIREAALLPHHVAEISGLKVLVMLDDFTHLGGYGPTSWAAWPKEALSSRDVGVIIAGRQVDGIAGPGGSEEMAGLSESWHLGGMTEEEAGRMLRSLLRAAGLELADGIQEQLVEQAEGKPFALKILVQALGKDGRANEAAWQRAYAASVCRGGLYGYWMGILSGAFPRAEGRKRALEVLVTCLREEQPPPEIGGLAAHMLLSGGEVEEALTGLGRAGLIRVDCSSVHVLPDGTLRDFAFSLYRQETEGTGGDFVEAALAAEKIRETGVRRKDAARRSGRSRLRDLMVLWSGQKVPRRIFAAGEFNRDYGSLSPDDALEKLSGEKELLTLPRVVSVASGLLGSEAGLPALDADAVAWAEQGGGRAGPRQVCWVVKFCASATVGEEEIEVFEQRVSALQSAGVLQPENAVKWLIAPEGFLPEALECASRHRILVSTALQAVLLGRLLGKDLGELIPQGAREEGEGKALEFEMTIPMVSETELVAARAVEQLAENMNFDPNEIGRIKMALVEACINAFEHSGGEDDKVRLRFSSDGRSLAIRVENRGRRFQPLKIAGAGRKKEMTKRGWGLSLIRELMDEVEFEPRDDGASLVMVKHLSERVDGGEQV
jgi:serine/threonine-protein kinase RsbW